MQRIAGTAADTGGFLKHVCEKKGMYPQGSHRVYRGGSWYYGAGCCTSSYRDCLTPSLGNYYYGSGGFRLVRSLSN